MNRPTKNRTKAIVQTRVLCWRVRQLCAVAADVCGARWAMAGAFGLRPWPFLRRQMQHNGRWFMQGDNLH